jgi:hypothetical protein
MRQTYKQRQARKRPADEIEDMPTEAASDTAEAAGLVEVINEVLES